MTSDLDIIFARSKDKYQKSMDNIFFNNKEFNNNKKKYNQNKKLDLFEKIKDKLIQEDAIIVAHYYVDSDIQELAKLTGGIVADSLEMAKFGAKAKQKTLIVCGVHFMGETAKILSPEKKILMPDLNATCSLDLNCPIEEFNEFCDLYPEREVIVYANSSIEVKARADWVVTSSIALDVVDYLHSQGKKLLWAPDKYLGSYIKRKTQADMILWQGSCIVHEEFKINAIKNLLKQYPDSALLVHPESPEDVVLLAESKLVVEEDRVRGVVGSTSQLLKASKSLPNKSFIVATDAGILYQMKKDSPDKLFLEAPTGGEGATCRSCARCPWMAMNSLESLLSCFSAKSNKSNIVKDINKDLLIGAKKSLDKMINFNN